MKTTSLILIFLLLSSYLLKAQCIDKLRDTTSVHCGGSVQLYTGLSATYLSFPTSHSLNQIIFADQMVGYIAGDGGTILKTTDGGTNWSVIEYLPVQDWISVSFTSQQTGVIVSKTGTVAKTTNGGINWEVVYEDAGKQFTRITNINENTYIAVGEMGLILKTTNGGTTWDSIPSGTTVKIHDIEFVNETNGFIAGDHDYNQYTNVFLRTTDGGNTWINTAVANEYSIYEAIAFANENVGYVTASYNTFKTTDGGESWTAVSWLGNISIALLDDSTGYSASIYDINKFSHYGTEYQNINYSFPGYINDIACPDDKRLFVIGASGFLYSSFAPVSYHWEPSTGLSADNVESPVASPMEPTIYTATVLYSNGITCTDSITVLIQEEWYNPNLCMVTVDSTSMHYKIIWNEPALSTADSVYIYKDGTITGQPIRLAGFSAFAPGEYVDLQSNSAVKTEWYAMNVIDKCNISYMGFGHSPVHLAINQGVGNTWNLMWSDYHGALLLTYNIYRGSTSDNLQLLASVSGGITQYTDLNAPAGDITYQIEAILDVDCSLSKEATPSYSNLARYSPNGNQDDESVSDYTISNNPVDEQFSITGNKNTQISAVRLLSLRGELVATWDHPTNATFNISGISPGVYILKIDLMDKPQSIIRKLIKL